MCAHYTLYSDDEMRELENIVRIVEKKLGKKQPMDVWPGYTVPVLLPAAEKNLVVQPMVWGYPVPHIKKDGTKGHTEYRQNAKVENARRLGIWRESYQQRRCLIPAASFDENKKLEDGSKKLYTFYSPGEMLYIAGIFEIKNGEHFCSMLTTEPNATVRGIHNRMPLVLHRGELGQWLYGQYDKLGDREQVILQMREAA